MILLRKSKKKWECVLKLKEWYEVIVEISSASSIKQQVKSKTIVTAIQRVLKEHKAAISMYSHINVVAKRIEEQSKKDSLKEEKTSY